MDRSNRRMKSTIKYFERLGFNQGYKQIMSVLKADNPVSVLLKGFLEEVNSTIRNGLSPEQITSQLSAWRKAFREMQKYSRNIYKLKEYAAIDRMLYGDAEASENFTSFLNQLKTNIEALIEAWSKTIKTPEFPRGLSVEIEFGKYEGKRGTIIAVNQDEGAAKIRLQDSKKEVWVELEAVQNSITLGNYNIFD